MTKNEQEALAEFAQDVARNRDHALYWLQQNAQGRNPKSLHSDLMKTLPHTVQEVIFKIGQQAVDEALGGLLCSLWTDDRFQVNYVNDEGSSTDLKQASDGWHGDYIGFGTHGGWIHQYSKYGNGLPPTE